MKIVLGPQEYMLKAKSNDDDELMPVMQRQYFIGGNWKMNCSKSEAIEMVNLLNEQLLISPFVELVIAPPSVFLALVREELTADVGLSAQNCYKKETGAFTGEISPLMIADIGAEYVVIGHSERREIFNETDTDVAEKVEAALSAGLKVIVCVGESKLDQSEGKALIKCANQISALWATTVNDWQMVVIAYEPIWAIGTGEVATPEQVQKMHRFLRTLIRLRVGNGAADSVRIIYGGSVTHNNCSELIKEKDVDGFLIGGASLKPEFISIYDSVSKEAKNEMYRE